MMEERTQEELEWYLERFIGSIQQCLEEHENGRTLWVAIADVARFVKQGSMIDLEAAERGTSVYFTQKVVPMLPETISNDLCSLRPNEDKFCLVCKTTIDKNKNIVASKVYAKHDENYMPASIKKKLEKNNQWKKDYK